MMPHRGAISDRRFRGTDVHSTVDLHRVGDHQLGVGMLTGKSHGNVALARRSRPEDDQWSGCNHPARTAMRRLCIGSASTSTKLPTR